MQDFTKLRAWQLSHALSVRIYHTFTPRRCRSAPGLRGQVIKSASAPAAHIAEGCGKISPLELARYADMGCGSLSELRSHLIYARDIKVVDGTQFKVFEKEVELARRTIVALARSVREHNEADDTDPNDEDDEDSDRN